MRLAEYLDDANVRAFCRDCDVTPETVYKAIRGERISRYDVAKRISEATGGQVSIEELCEPESGEAA